MPYFREIPQTVTAVIVKPDQFNGKNHGGKKEMTGAWSLIVHDGATTHEAVTVRTWMGRSNQSSVVYAAVWTNSKDGKGMQCGHGQAGGYGYHKESEAIARAVESAGFELYGTPYRHTIPQDPGIRFSFGGTGSSAYPEIFAAIARAIGWDTTGALMISHGA